jgi:hypothetical protein
MGPPFIYLAQFFPIIKCFKYRLKYILPDQKCFKYGLKYILPDQVF